MKPSEVLRAQADLVASLEPGRPAALQLNATARNQRIVNDDDGHVSRNVQAHVRYARAFLITEHMGDVLLRRALDETRLPAVAHCPSSVEPPRQCGFAVFDRPLPLPELRGRRQLAHVFTWGPVVDHSTKPIVSGWVVTAWNDTLRQPDDIVKEAIHGYTPEQYSLLGRWWPIHTMYLAHEQRLGRATHIVTGEERAELEARYGTEPPIVLTETPNQIRSHVALWQLLGETTHVHGATEEEIGRPDRPGFRMARRLGLESDITVITLRRAAEPVQHPGTGTPLDHRVPVIQHRRTYWCKGDDGVLHRESRIIAAHERGPKDAPLVIRKKMERLSR